jgi:hypothetical protein
MRMLLQSLGTGGLHETSHPIRGYVLWSEIDEDVPHLAGPRLTRGRTPFPGEPAHIDETALPNVIHDGSQLAEGAWGDEHENPDLNLDVILIASSDGISSSREDPEVMNQYVNSTCWPFDGTTDAYISRDFDSYVNSDDGHRGSGRIERFAIIKDIYRRAESLRILRFLAKARGSEEFKGTILEKLLRAQHVGFGPRTLVPAMLTDRESLPKEWSQIANANLRQDSGLSNMARILTWSIAFEATYAVDNGQERAQAIASLLPKPDLETTADQYYLNTIEYLLRQVTPLPSLVRQQEKQRLWEYLVENQTTNQWQSGFFWFPWTERNDWRSFFALMESATSQISLLDVWFGMEDAQGVIRPYSASQGEIAFLKICSRIYDARNRRQKQIDEEGLGTARPRQTLLLLDEVDLALHPEWQRQFLKSLLPLMDSSMAGETVQLLISTHSPLLLSDFPHPWCTRLVTDDGEIPVSHSSDIEKPTFGGNLYDLLADDFFLKGSMGEFAASVLRQELHRERTQKVEDDVPVSDIVSDPLILELLRQARSENES